MTTSKAAVPIAAVSENGHLRQAYRRYGDSHIYLCAMEGPVHRSYCIFCPNFTGRAPIGDTDKRRPTACRNVEVGNHSIFFAEIVDEKIKYPTQQEVDVRYRLPSLNNTDGTNQLAVPLAETKIKSAYNPDVSSWDILKFGATYCFRCGPDYTRGVQYRCVSCKSLSLCDNCLVDREESLGDNNVNIVQFTCPDCDTEQEINLGRNNIHATFYTREASNQKTYHDIGVHLPVEFGMISQRIRCSSELRAMLVDEPNSTDAESAFKKPDPDAKLYRISGGMLSGLYWVNEQDHKAWRCLIAPDWRVSHLIRSTPGLIIDNFTTDVILSYRTEDLVQVERLRIQLEQVGLSVFLIVSEQNKQDTLWDIRFSEAIYRARNFIFVASETYFESSSTRMEVREFLIAEKVRRELTKSKKNYLHGTQIEATETQLFNEFDANDQVAILSRIKTPSEIIRIISKRDEAHDGLFWRNIKMVEPLIGETDTCPNCYEPLFFDDELDKVDEAKRLEILSKSNAAYACKANHRYCSACDTNATQGGLSGVCAICSSAEKNRMGYRAPRDIYFSNVNPSPLFGFKYNPNDLECLNCQQPIDFEKSEALVCDKGHRHCSECACKHIPSNHNVCPECMNGPTERLVVGMPVSTKIYFYGAKIDLPMIVEQSTSTWCGLCFVELSGAPVVKFRTQFRSCGPCMSKIENNLNMQSYYSQQYWLSIRKELGVGLYSAKYDSPTCEICKRASTANNPVGFEVTKTLGSNHIWTACKSCLTEARKLLANNTFD